MCTALSLGSPSLLFPASAQDNQNERQQSHYRYQRYLSRCSYAEILTFSDRYLFSIHHDQLHIWDTISGSKIKDLHDFCGKGLSSHVVEDAEVMVHYATFGLGGNFKVFDKTSLSYLWGHESNNCTWQYFLFDQYLIGVIARNPWSCEEQKLLSIPDQIMIWNKLDGSMHGKIFENICISSLHVDSGCFFALTDDGFVKFWDAKTGALIKKLSIVTEKKEANLFSDLHQIIVQYIDGSVNIWDYDSLELKKQLPFIEITKKGSKPNLIVNDNTIISCAGGIAVARRRDNLQQIFTLHSCDAIKYLDNNKLAIFRGGVLEVLDAFSGTTLYQLVGDLRVWAWAKSDDSRIISLTAENELRIWNKETGELLATISKISHFLSKEERLCIAYMDGFIDICDFSKQSDWHLPSLGQFSFLQR